MYHSGHLGFWAQLACIDIFTCPAPLASMVWDANDSYSPKPILLLLPQILHSDLMSWQDLQIQRIHLGSNSKN